jgi:hypothetical protein
MFQFLKVPYHYTRLTQHYLEIGNQSMNQACLTMTTKALNTK